MTTASELSSVEVRDVPGWEGKYRVSSTGLVFGHSGSPLSPHRNRKGYLCVGLYDRQTKKRTGVHQLVAAAFIGPKPDGRQVCHNNGDPADNRASNLRYDTQRGNALDAVRHGTIPTGERSPLAKLSSDQVHYARANYKPWCRKNGGAALARRFGVAQPTIFAAVSGENWKSLTL